MARRRKGRPVTGILVLDKPVGPSSNQALQRVRHLFGAAKGGHTGNLDPLASGVLPICLGEATKLSQFLLDSDKAYEAQVTFGVSTATGDSEGEVLAQKNA
ncbi:tRNA pseudouridine(55) synthase TruB, partial [Luminiphilus sp.]|nr:tRNA pseudouridine(55) synthase TruB [Luminiphilus sp.]